MRHEALAFGRQAAADGRAGAREDGCARADRSHERGRRKEAIGGENLAEARLHRVDGELDAIVNAKLEHEGAELLFH